jgi:AraC family transcriptional regulator
VIDHVDRHLDDDLTVDRLSGIAAFSKYHFHRQFTGLFGMGVYEYVRLVRLKRASYDLAFREQRSVIDIALDSGYESPEAFARAFKRRIGQTPSEFRKQPAWIPWHATYQRMHDLRSDYMKQQQTSERVKSVVFEATRVAVLEHRGDPRLIGGTIRTFIEWRKQNHLPPRVSQTFNILYNDPQTTPPDEFRLDLCAATQGPVAENAVGVVERTIPGGRCAVLRHTGSDDGLGASLHHLYAEWLPASGEEPRDFPLFLQRVRFFPDVPEHEAITDIFLPLK